MELHILGIRHHGPGSARNVAQALRQLKPDLVLVEGPAEAEALVPDVLNPQMVPPVAILGYQTTQPANAVFYPFVSFSPEWQAMTFAAETHTPLRFFDLPLSYSLSLMAQQRGAQLSCAESKESAASSPTDPFSLLAAISGYADGEEWWDSLVERRTNNLDTFAVLMEAVAALRNSNPQFTSDHDLVREAWMRKGIRQAQTEMFGNVVVVCGAWHAPALASLPPLKEDKKWLQNLSKVKVACSWVPWSFERLSMRSGYGAGVVSPGWYQHLWNNPADDGSLWLIKVAALLRKHRLDVSAAHVIAAVNLAKSLAALRGLAQPGLCELNEAVVSVMGRGNEALLQWVKQDLEVGTVLGAVPQSVVNVPILQDFILTAKHLRLSFLSLPKTYQFDLRKPFDLSRSTFCHRLLLLEVEGVRTTDNKSRGTFRENWTLQHPAGLELALIGKAVWGNTVEQAVATYVAEQMRQMSDIRDLAQLLQQVIPADLPALSQVIIQQLDALSASAMDVSHLLAIIPPLASVVRYGSVRHLKFDHLLNILRTVAGRISANGMSICCQINEEVAQQLYALILKEDGSILSLADASVSAMWVNFLRQYIQPASAAHPLLVGLACRLLYEHRLLSPAQMSVFFSFQSGSVWQSAQVAGWFEGCLKGTGIRLVLDQDLWTVLALWVHGLDNDHFTALLPALRRTFADFSRNERHRLMLKVQNSEEQVLTAANEKASSPAISAPDVFSYPEVQTALLAVERLLGLPALPSDQPLKPDLT